MKTVKRGPYFFVSIVSMTLGIAMLGVAVFLHYRFGTQLAAVEAKNDPSGIQHLARAVRYFVFWICPGLAINLIASNYSFLEYLIKTAPNRTD